MRPSNVLPRCLLALAATLAFAPAAMAAAPGSGLRVLQHQALEKLQTDPAGRPASFEVYGRRFELELERNDRLLFVTPKAMPDVEALRGKLRGLPRSWVRVTRTPAGLYGMFSDGSDVYAIEPAHELADSAVGPLAARGNAPVVFRLADTLMPADGASCATVTLEHAVGGTTALEQLQAVGAELRSALATGSLEATRQMEIGVVADFEFSRLTLGGLTPEQAIAARMNVVDGIYSSQAGVKLIVSSATVFRDAADPFSATLNANTLLDELGDWRRSTPSQTSAGLTHLMTGRDLDGTTVGIAYISALCSSRFGVGLSQATGLSATTASLVIAHEIGHNFGARHDGEAGSVCEATPQTFLMAPRLNGSDQFSQCSLDTIAPRIASASCIVPLEIADAALDLPAPSPRPRGTAFDYGFTVRSVGERQVEGLAVSVALPAALAFDSGGVAGGLACTSSGSTVRCSIGTLAPGASRGITLSLTGQQAGPAAATFTLDADNDAIAGNDSGQVTFDIEPSADLAVSLAASPARFTAGGTSQVTATVRHVGGDAVGDARLSLTIPAGLSVTAVGSNALDCALSAGSVGCGAVALAPSSVETVTLTVTGSEPGSRQLGAGVSSTTDDPAAGNDSAQVQITVDAPPAGGSGGSGGGSSSSSGGGGGGGALGVLSLLALLGLTRRRARAYVVCRSTGAGVVPTTTVTTPLADGRMHVRQECSVNGGPWTESGSFHYVRR